MSQENVEIVRDQFEATNEGDFARAMTYYAEDVKLVVHGGFLEVGTFEGREEVGRWFGDWFRSFQRGYRFELEETTDLGHAVFVVASHGGRGRASGVEVRGSAAYIYRLRRGKIEQVEMYPTRAEALEAVGMQE
jgi:ketosteroid isomerase-like protein